MASEPMTTSRSTEWREISASASAAGTAFAPGLEISAAVRRDRLDNVPDEGLVLHAARRETGSLVAAPDHDVGGLLDLLDLVAVDDLLIAGEIDGARSLRAQLLADRKQHRVAQAAADEQGSLLARRFRGRAGGTHQDQRLARFEQRAQIGGSAHFEHDGREQPFFAIDRRAGEG